MKKGLLAILMTAVLTIAMTATVFADWGGTSSSGWGSATTVTDEGNGLYSFDDTTTRAFLVVGEDKAVLIDTMYAKNNILDEVRKITDLPIEVVLTHGHPDHIGGISSFADCKIYIDEDDAYMLPDGITASYIADGDVISVGSYEFTVIEIPGHTYGSIALLDKNSGILIAGDSVQEGPIMMFDEEADMETYAASMKKLMAYQDQVKAIYGGHHTSPAAPEYITYCYEDAMSYLNGELEPTPITSWNGNATVYYGKNVSFQLPELEEEPTTEEETTIDQEETTVNNETSEVKKDDAVITPSDNDVPKTGDSNSVMGMIVLLVLAAAAILAAVFTSKKNRA